MTPTERLESFLKSGAVLTLFENGAPIVEALIASDHILTADRFIYFTVADTITGNVHALQYDELREVNPFGVEFRFGGRAVAYVFPISEANDEQQAAWAGWQEWLKANHETFTPTITAELRHFADDAP